MVTVQDWLRNLVNVSDDELDMIGDITETIAVKANETVHKQGQVATRVGLILQGATRTYFTDAQGNEKTVAFFFEGQPLIAVDSFLNRVPSPVSSETLEPSVIAWTDYERFTAFVNKYPKYNTAFIAAISHWFANGRTRMEYLHQPTAKAKYDMMCKLDPKIAERIPLKHIASYLGITQETLSRIRSNK